MISGKEQAENLTRNLKRIADANPSLKQMEENFKMATGKSPDHSIDETPPKPLKPEPAMVIETPLEQAHKRVSILQTALAASAEQLSKRNAEFDNVQQRMNTASTRIAELDKKLNQVQAGLESATGVLAELRVQHRSEIAKTSALQSVLCMFASKGKRS